jgi:hypothetical protein
MLAIFKSSLVSMLGQSKQSDQKFGKSCPIFGNVAQTVAKLQKLELKVKHICIKQLLNVKINKTNYVLKLLI